MVRIGTALGLFIAGLALFQDRLLYFPTHATVAEMASAALAPWPAAAQFRGLLAVPAASATIDLRRPQAPAPDSRSATAIVFHGNAGHAGHRSYYAQQLGALGLRVILAEYPGYGPRDGELGETSLVDDAEQTILQAHREFGSPLLLIGESLGAAVAAAAAARVAGKIEGLLLITPWDSLAHVAAHHYPWLPVRWLLSDRYDTMTHLQAFDRPVVVVLAGQDAIIPVRYGRGLYDALSQPKQLVLLEGAGHNDWPDKVDLEWWRGITDGLLSTR